MYEVTYSCTTCGEKPPTSAGAAAAAKGKSRNREASPESTILGRNLASGPIPPSGYALCFSYFEKVGVDHAWASCVNGTFSTPQELSIARRSPPKEKGQLRHAYVERVWDTASHCWKDVGARFLFVTCTEVPVSYKTSRAGKYAEPNSRSVRPSCPN